MKKIALIVVLALASVACAKEEKEEQKKKFCLDESFKARIAFDTAELRTVTEGIHLTGSVEASPDRVVSYVPLVSGVVTSTFFSLGDRVTRGQVLAEMQSTELSGMSAALAALESRIRAAESKRTSVQAMFDDGIASRKELADAVSEVEVLQAEKARTEKDMSLYSGNSGKGVFQIRAPATGIITDKNVNPGEQISAGGSCTVYCL
ncbi:MAG: efflux RND transporter periplasmic adaptor subunit [Leadbetterella sp.]|nr:efflux RND transporter periplasmic adaptor subunit [Leadbetterella sp.]